MDEIEVEEDTLEIRELLGALKDNIMAIIAVTVVLGFLGFLLSAFVITPKYEASVNMIVNTRQDSSATVTNDNITSARNLVSTYAVILKSNIVLEEVIDRLDLELTYDELKDMITVGAVDDTQVMKVAVLDSDPQRGKEIMETIAEIAPDVIVDAVEAGSCKVISSVETGENPVSPDVKKYIAVAAAAGLVLSAGFVILKRLLHCVVVDDADVQKYLELPVLGVIPEIEEGK